MDSPLSGESLRIIGRTSERTIQNPMFTSKCAARFHARGRNLLKRRVLPTPCNITASCRDDRALAQIAPCDILLVLLYETAYSPAIVPHKLYHYLGLGKPILALGPESGEMFRILSETNDRGQFSRWPAKTHGLLLSGWRQNGLKN